METEGEAVPDPVSDAVNSPRNIEQEKQSHSLHKENSENGQPDKTEAIKPFSCAEQMVEIPACQDCSPKRNTVLDASLQMSRGRGEEPVGLEVHGIQAADNAVPRRSLWGEEMSGVSRSHSSHISQNRVFKAALQSIQHQSDLGLDLSKDRVGPTDFSSFTHDQLKSEALGVLSRRGKESSRLVVPEDGSSNLEEIHNHSFGSTSIPAGSAEGDDPALLAMFRAVANSRLAIRSQQKDEPDFTPAQKLAILRDLYKAKPLVFLERFRAALKEEHLSCFQHLMGNYEADFYCAEVRRAGLGKTRHTRVRNKRYAALQQLIRGGEYFSDEQMRSREPLLYEQYIGQYLSNEELQALDSCKREASHCLSGVLLDSYQEEVIQRRLQVQQEQEEACEEEEEEDSDEDHDEDQSSDSEMDAWAPDPEEKAFLREEFTSRMYQRFLEGQDRDFNYSEVDENPDFDNLDIVSRDEEERYFDGEDPEEAEAMEAE